MTSSYFNSPLTGIDYELDQKAFPTWKPDPDNTFNWTAQQEKEPTFGDYFKDALKQNIGSYTKRFAGAGEKTGGDNYIKSEGATTADLGGGNTLYVPDDTAHNSGWLKRVSREAVVAALVVWLAASLVKQVAPHSAQRLEEPSAPHLVLLVRLAVLL